MATLGTFATAPTSGSAGGSESSRESIWFGDEMMTPLLLASLELVVESDIPAANMPPPELSKGIVPVDACFLPRLSTESKVKADSECLARLAVCA